MRERLPMFVYCSKRGRGIQKSPKLLIQNLVLIFLNGGGKVGGLILLNCFEYEP